MGKKRYGGFIKFSIPKQDLEIENEEKQEEVKSNESSFIDESGHVTLESISNNREWFYGKTIDDIAEILEKCGYIVKERDSRRKTKGSKALILEIKNTSKVRNIAQIQVSPGSARHGEVPYVKISTIDIGKIKVVDSLEKDYVTDGHESATILFRR